MTEQNQNSTRLLQLRRALKAVSKSIYQVLEMGDYGGTASMLVKSYRKLHARALEMMPDDFFVESLELEVDDSMDDRQIATQVKLAVDQLLAYVDSTIREERPWTMEFDELKSFGTELRDHVIHMTRSTLKNAIANIDFGVINDEDLPDENADDESGKQNIRKRKVRIEVQVPRPGEAEDSDEDNIV